MPRLYNRGFSLIEMMVAVSIFSIVMMIAASSVLAIVDANRKAQSLKSVVNNLNFAVETIGRNLRVGTNYRCHNTITGGPSIEAPRSCPTGETILALESQYGRASNSSDQLIYIFDDNYYGTVNGEPRGAILRQVGNQGGAPVPLTAPEVDIDLMEFHVNGAEVGDALQPFVRIHVRGTAAVGTQETSFNIQTAVAQRTLDI